MVLSLRRFMTETVITPEGLSSDTLWAGVIAGVTS